MNKIGAIFLTVAFSVLSLQSPAEGGTFEVIAAGEGNQVQGYAFLSPNYSLALGKGHFVVLRASVNYLYYEFDDLEGKTEVRSPGADVGVSLRWSTDRLNLSLGPGYGIRNTERTFTDGDKLEETEEGFNLLGTLFFQATPLTNLNLIYSYNDSNGYSWARAGAKRQVTNTDFQERSALALGAEITGQGNDDFSSFHAGLLGEIAFLQTRSALQLRTGYAFYQSSDSSDKSRPYLGVSVYTAF